jgi:hypothetical protein
LMPDFRSATNPQGRPTGRAERAAAADRGPSFSTAQNHRFVFV